MESEKREGVYGEQEIFKRTILQLYRLFSSLMKIIKSMLYEDVR